VDDHQRRMWSQMLDRVDEYEHGRIDLARLVEDLRGLFIEADPHDVSTRQSFEDVWLSLDIENELRTEGWAPPGVASPESLHRAVESFRSQVRSILDADPTEEHR
jgi:hypothetical protein